MPVKTPVVRNLLQTLIALCCFCVPAMAQQEAEADQDLTPLQDGGRGLLLLGKFFQNPSDLNELTAARGLGSFKNALLLGVMGYGIVRERVLIGGEAYAITYGDTSGQTNAAYSMDLGGGLGFVNVGYLLSDGPRFNLYPTIGLGGGMLSLKAWQTSGGSFSSVLDDPRRGSYLHRGFLAMNFAVGADMLIDLHSGPSDIGGLVLGFRAGLVVNLASFGWKVHETDVSDGPETTLEGLHFEFLIGGGGGRLKK